MRRGHRCSSRPGTPNASRAPWTASWSTRALPPVLFTTAATIGYSSRIGGGLLRRPVRHRVEVANRPLARPLGREHEDADERRLLPRRRAREHGLWPALEPCLARAVDAPSRRPSGSRSPPAGDSGSPAPDGRGDARSRRAGSRRGRSARPTPATRRAANVRETSARRPPPPRRGRSPSGARAPRPLSRRTRQRLARGRRRRARRPASRRPVSQR